MQLLLASGEPATVSLAGAAKPPLSAPAGWQRQLAFAQSRLTLPVPEANAGGARREGEPAELESCGIPGSPAVPHLMLPTPLPFEPVDPPSPSHDPQRLQSEHRPVRVHIDPPGAQGLQVWLGIDGVGALGSPGVAALISEIRRGLAGTQDRLGLLVCNGIPLHRDAPADGLRTIEAPSSTRNKETPWR